MRTLGYTTARAALLAVASAVSAAMKSTFVGCFDNRHRWAFSASQAISSPMGGVGRRTAPCRESLADRERDGCCISACRSRHPRSSLLRGSYPLSRKPSGTSEPMELYPRQSIVIEKYTDKEASHDRCTES